MRKRYELHGESYSLEYSSWNNMHQRCRVGSKDRAKYFDRGIAVCERWADFGAFLSDMGRRPSPRHSIDRIDNNRGYEPENCRWATAKEQGANTRKTRFVEALGVAMPLRAWARVTGLDHHAVAHRLRIGMHPDDAILAPSRKKP